ncbi:MAG: hypothetical protein AMS26_15300 [Bacteroides sp. SM23_62]|nr:MAG: hypothetical protein AMS26_15300 [Bacteroides sp. SM23_62]
MKKFIRLCISFLFLVQGIFLFAQEPDSIFSDVEFLGNANNYTEAVDSLWEVFTDSVDMEVVYGIVYDKPVGGNRTSILNERTYGAHGNFYVSADMKLQKRPSAVEDNPWWEDGRLFFAWQNDTNYAYAMFFNTNGPAKENPIGQGDALGLSGFYFVVNGKGYGYIHSDDPGDPVEEIPPETCIPYESDTSFYDWNEVMVTLEDSVLSMLVNGEVYHAIGLDTVTLIEYYTGNVLDTIDTIPSAEFSNVPHFGDAANYDEAEAWLWDVFSDEGNPVYGIIQDKPAGGNRTTIAQEKMFGGHDYYVEADMKLQKRPSGVADSPWWEDGRLFFAWQDASNYARAQFFNTHGPAKDNPIGQGDALGLSGFMFMVDGQGYGFIHSDDPGDPVEEIPAETCIPFEGDTSFYDWNNVRVMLKDSVLSMLVNGEVYHAIGLDTVTMIEYYTGNVLDTIDTIPAAVMDLVFTGGQVGIGSSNDRVYFDNVKAGWVSVEGVFSDIEFLGDAGNYTEVNPWLWGVIEEDGDTRYGITEPKESGGNRMSILNDTVFGYWHNRWYIEAEAKLFKRATGAPDQSLFEDAVLFFSYVDENNYAQAMFFNHPGIGVEGDPQGQGDAFGISGIRFVYEGQSYRLDKTDDPGDPIEEIPPERCIPFVDDNSFNDWNTIRLERNGTILTMLVNGEEYWALDVDTLTVAQIYGGDGYASWQFNKWAEVPQGAKQMLLGTGQIGVGSSNDKVYFDNIDMGFLPVTGVFSDIEFLGDAANYTEVDPWLWAVTEIDGDMRYSINLIKTYGGNRMSILNDRIYDDDWFVEADVKLFKGANATENQSLFEDAGLFFCYQDMQNWATAMYFNHCGSGVTGDPSGQVYAFGISGIRFTYDGQEYGLTKKDDPGDPIEEIPPERCIPYEDDNSFNDWNLIRLEREGTIFTMKVNGEEYWAIDIDTLTVAQIYEAGTTWKFDRWEEVPQGAKDMLLGPGQIGIGSSNDMVAFDNVDAGLYTSVEEHGDPRMSAVLIYPNPASDRFTIAEIDHVRKIEMYNLSGQRVMEMTTHGENSVTIHTNRFRSGMYFIQLHSDKGNVAVGKIMIE